MFEMLQLLAGTNLFLLAFSLLIFDIPRYTLSLFSLALLGVWRRSDSVPAGCASVSVIIPTFNGGVDRGLVVCIDLGFGRVAGYRDARHDDGRDNPEDRDDSQQFHEREARSFIIANGFHSSSPNRHFVRALRKMDPFCRMLLYFRLVMKA